MSKTHNDNTLFMHCLPSYHDFETETARVKHEQGLDVREVDDEVSEAKTLLYLMKQKTVCIRSKQLW